MSEETDALKEVSKLKQQLLIWELMLLVLMREFQITKGDFNDLMLAAEKGVLENRFNPSDESIQLTWRGRTLRVKRRKRNDQPPAC